MSQPVANYTFLPWLRQGIARQISSADGDNTVQLRTTVPVDLELAAEGGPGGKLTQPVHRDVQIYGPGDIVGIDSKIVVRTEPRDWITNFEPNYLAFVEFYDEDFPWRYTPAAPNGHRLRPWIMLVVLEEGEFTEGKNLQNRPLPFIQVSDAAGKFPPANELWAWAHVHVNTALDNTVVSDNMNAVLPKLEQILNSTPDLACSRLLCPRELEPNKSYHAFVVPVFETGRLAGLGQDPAGAPFATAASMDAYQNRPEGELFPYYYRWTFRTGDVGDFEYLVRLLQPRPMDVHVGRRDMDVSNPGANLPALDDPNVGNILKLGGALRVPVNTLKPADKADYLKFENWALPGPHPWQKKLSVLLNLADDYKQKNIAQAHQNPDLDIPDDLAGDPLITPPIYGQWHALTNRLMVNADGTPAAHTGNWVHELNLDPRFRVAAGFGTQVVQENQETLMDAAWNQIGKVLEGNRRIRLGHLAEAASFSWHNRVFVPLAAQQPAKMLMLTMPVQKRVLSQGVTVYSTVASSTVATTVLSAPMRRAFRPGGRLQKRLPFNDQIRPIDLVTRLNAGEIVLAPPKTVPAAVPTLDQAANTVTPGNVPGWLRDWLGKYKWLPWVAIGLAVLIVLLLLLLHASGVWLAVGGAIAAGLVYLWRVLTTWQKQEVAADAAKEENQTPEVVNSMPKSPDFRLSKPGESFSPKRGLQDSAEAVRFKSAIAEFNGLLVESASVAPKQPVRSPLAIGKVAQQMAAELAPSKTIPVRILNSVVIPDRIRAILVELFDDVMAYPVFDKPMYEPLSEISSELFLPNIHLIEPNTISLLETNQKFIESYMVGLNHEFARELLWREYPTDQRGSYFRQFWDVSSFFPPPPAPPPEKLQENLRDIPELHKWSLNSQLGDHDNREQGGDKEEEVVLVIRGELLKKYPNTVIYAQKAAWQKKANSNENDLTKPRTLAPIPDGQEEHPPRELVRTPLYEAQVKPDIYFFGFDLTAEAAKGESGENPNDDPGWFFVLKERPGEPRFGLDNTPEQDNAPGPAHTWNDLAWKDNLVNAKRHLKAVQSVNLNFQAPQEFINGVKNPEYEQYDEDRQVAWTNNVTAAELAYILYQVPFMVGVHAAEMLPKTD